MLGILILCGEMRTDADGIEPRLMQPLIDSAVRHGLLEKTVAASELIAKV